MNVNGEGFSEALFPYITVHSRSDEFNREWTCMNVNGESFGEALLPYITVHSRFNHMR